MKKKYLIAAALLAVCGCQKYNESTVVKGKAHQQHVEVGGFYNNDIIVLSGLAAGDEVIVGGQQKVSEGMGVSTDSNAER